MWKKTEAEAENKLAFNTNIPFFVLNSRPTHIVVFTHIATYYQCTQARLLKASSVLTHTQAIQHTVCVFSFANLPVDKVSIYQTDTHRAAAGLSTGIYDILQHLECCCAQHVKLLRRNGVNASKSVHVLMFFSC